MGETKYLDKIVMVEVKSIVPYEDNARHNDDAVKYVMENIKQFGFAVPIILDKDNVVIAGHARLKAAKKMKLKEVPCVIADYLNENQVRAMRLSENKSHEFATWDLDLMEAELAKITGVDLLALGFEGYEDLEFSADYQNETEESLEEIMESEECIVTKGDIWRLGKHRLMCGDSTKREDIEALMDGEMADLVVTDPPYNVNYVGMNEMTIENDNMSVDAFSEFLASAFENINEFLKIGRSFYVFYHSRDHIEFEEALEQNSLSVKQVLIWVKHSFVFGRSDYHWRHEPILYGWKEGAAPYFCDDRTLSTVIDESDIDKMTEEEVRDGYRKLLEQIKTTIIYADKPLRSDEHPTMKPVLLLIELIRNSSKINELVVDYFGGSGSTLIASEQCSRVCYMNELDEIYCTRAIRRWERLTGETAVKERNIYESN